MHPILVNFAPAQTASATVHRSRSSGYEHPAAERPTAQIALGVFELTVRRRRRARLAIFETRALFLAHPKVFGNLIEHRINAGKKL